MSTAIGVSLPRLATAVGKAISEYAVLGKTPGFTADFIKNKYPGKANFASAINHARAGNATMTDGYGPELVVNGGFSDDSDWTKGTGWSIADGVATHTTTTGSYLQTSASPLTVGKTYVFSVKITAIASGTLSAYGSGYYGTAFDSVGNHSMIFTADASYFRMRSTGEMSIDNVSVREMPVIKWAPHNLVAYSEDLGNWTNFNTTDSLNQIVAPDGTTTADKVVENSSSTVHNIYQTGHTNVVSGVDYTFCTFVKQGEYKWVQLSFALSNSTFTANDFANFDVNAGTVGTTGSGATATIEDVGNGWYKCSVTATAAASASSGATICLTDNTNASSRNPSYSGDGSSGIYVWGMHFNRADLGGMVDNPDRGDSYVPTASSAKYLPRIGHHVYNGSAWVNEGLLAESESRVNIIPYSDFSSGWTFLNSTPQYDTATAPDGTNGAFKLAADTGVSPSCYVAEASIMTFGLGYTVSVYAKAGTNDSLRIANVSSPSSGAWFDLTNGTIGTQNGSGNTATIEDVGNGWYRCSRYFDSVSTGGDEIILGNNSADGATAAPSAGEYIYLYGPQCELGATSSSLIPTSGSSVSRAAETFTIPSANLPWPTPQYIGSELVTNGTFDTDVSGWSSWQSGTFSHNASGYVDVDNDGAAFGGIQQDITTVVGKVYKVTAELSNNTASSNVTLLARSVAPSATIEAQGITTGNASGSYDILFVATTTTSKIAFEAADSTATFSLDNISVREINPLSVSIGMEGRMTYADDGLKGQYELFRWLKDGSNRVQVFTDTRAADTGQLYFSQAANASISEITTSATQYSPDILVPYNIASRHGSTFVNGAVEGVALTANTTPTALPDLSATDLSLAYDYNGTISSFRVWDRDITDAGLVEATNPSLEPSLSLTFEGVGTNSFVVNDWSQ